MVRFHLFMFMNRYKNVFSQNFLIEILSQTTSYAKSTLKKDFSNKDFLKVAQRIKEKDKNLGDIFEEIIKIIFKNKDNYSGLGNGEVFELMPDSIKEFKNIWLIQKNILENNIINDIDEKEMINILDSFHYQFCLYLNHFFNFNYEKFIISFFEKNSCKNDLLKAFFSSSYFNLGRDEKRNVKNIIKQKTIMKFNTLKKYFIEDDEFLQIIYYGLYLYLDYLKFLIKKFDINNEIFCKFIEKEMF